MWLAAGRLQKALGLTGPFCDYATSIVEPLVGDFNPFEKY